jgi:hypothetical protein
MADSHPPRRPATLIAILIIVTAAVAWLGLILAGPRSGFALLALHFFIAALVAMGSSLSGYLLTRRAAELDLLERLVLGFAVALALLLLASFALGLLGQIENLSALLIPLIILGVFGGIFLVRDVRASSVNPSPLGEGGPSGPGEGVVASSPLSLGRGWPEGPGEGLGPKTSQTRHSPSPWSPAAWLIVGLIVVLALVLLYGSWGECIDYDVLEYHAGVPAQWLHAGRIIDLPNNVYSYFPMTAEMLNLFAMGLHHDATTGAELGKLLGGVCTVWAALAIVCVGRRLFSLRAGLFSAALFLTIPWIFYVSIMGLVEGVQTFFTLAALAAAVALLVPRGEAECATVGLSDRAITNPHSTRRDETRRGTSGCIVLLALILGLVAGLTAGIKMTNLAFVLPPAALAVLIAARRRRLGWKPVAAFLLAAAIFAAPFYVRNLVLTGNPFFPVLSNLLGGPPGWTAGLAACFTHFHSPGEFTLAALWSALIGPDSVYYSFAVLFLIPFALVRRQTRRRVLALLALVLFMIAAWFFCTHRIGRLLVPAWGLLAIVAGAALEAFDALPARAVLIAAVILIARFDIALNLGMMESRALDLTMIGDSMQPSPDGRYDFKFDPNTTAHLWTYSPYAVRLVNDLAQHQPNIKVGLIGEAETLYFTVPVVYNTVFNRSWLEPAGEPTLEAVRARLAASGVTHLYVNWPEVERFSAAGNYGWPPWLNRDLFDRLEKAGAIRKLFAFGPPHEPPQYVIYEVVM